MNRNKRNITIGILSILIAFAIGISGTVTEARPTPTTTYYTSTNAVFYGSFTDISCNAGDQVISGGGDAGLNTGGDSVGSLRESRPLSNSVWRVASVNRLGQSIQTSVPSAICVHIT